MEINQALVTCGGTGSRLRKAGMDFPISKSFIEFEGHPMLYWCLLGLHYAGVERLVIVGNGTEKLERADKVLYTFPYTFSEVQWHEDPGLGTNGLPYQAMHLLGERFLFEFGHSLSEPEHYQRLEEALQDSEDVAMSMFNPNPCRSTPSIRLNGQKVTKIEQLTGGDNEFQVGTPYLLNRKYVTRLPGFEFDIHRIVPVYYSERRLRLVRSNLPIEVDFIDEWKEAVPSYRSHIEKLCARAQTSPNSSIS